MSIPSVKILPTARRRRQQHIIIGFLWLVFIDLQVVGFGMWAPYSMRLSSVRRQGSMLRDAFDNFPSDINLPAVPTKNNSYTPQLPPNFIAPEKLQYLQETVDIVSVIEAYGLPHFKRSGAYRATCLCPFHDDHNPSLSIDSTKGIFKCFSCGAGGNVITFVRDYAKLQGEKISFSQAVRLVDAQFASGNDTFKLSLPPGLKAISSGTNSSAPSLLSSQRKAKQKTFRTKEQRILQANAAAAAFFEKCLVSLPSAGPARSHLQARFISPRTVRAFAIGYAPDAYFGNRGESSPHTWGEGSLVEHLKEKGFSTTEILDAGLATVTKKEAQRLNEGENTARTLSIPYSSLVDRFRHRLMVPILDATGANVLGFGGRFLADSITGRNPPSHNFTQPKYLNSPESPVFQKKNILFGQHMADKALRFWDKDDSKPRAVVLVEGYFDAIALWSIGIREAIACMGTGLTTEQLTAAATLAGTKNGTFDKVVGEEVPSFAHALLLSDEGRVILCLDNDEAGTAAVERLCSSGILVTVEESHPVEFRVARLPEQVKDPAEFMELHRDDPNADGKFRLEVLRDSSLEWKDWYQGNLLDHFNISASNNEKGGLADVLERFAFFLSLLRIDESEKKIRIHTVTNQLSVMIADGNNEDDSVETIRLELESILRTKYLAFSRKVASLPTRSGTTEKVDQTLARMAPSSDPHFSSGRSLKKSRHSDNDSNGEQGRQSRANQASTFATKPRPAETRRSFRAARSQRNAKVEPSLTPHFSGFDFASKHDVEWLQDEEISGQSRGRLNRKAGRRYDSFGESNSVYHNSNEYHGRQFLTDDALSAGYTSAVVPRDPDLLSKGINSMVHFESNTILQSAENDLLRYLVNFPIARASLQRIMSISRSAGSQEILWWSHPEKSWLFKCLISGDPHIASLGMHNLTEFKAYLSGVPRHLFGELSGEAIDKEIGTESEELRGPFRGNEMSVTGPTNSTDDGRVGAVMPPHEHTLRNVEMGREITASRVEAKAEKSNGKLDFLFTETEGAIVMTEEKVSLAVQEAYYTMLWASSVQRYNLKREESVRMVQELGEPLDGVGSQNQNATHEYEHVEQAYKLLSDELQDASEQVKIHDSALKSFSSRLVQRSMPNLSFFHTQEREYNTLSARLNEHMAEIGKWSNVEEEGDENEEDSYETFLELSQLEWGDLYDDDRMWSTQDMIRASKKTSDVEIIDSIAIDNAGEEPMESFTQRMEVDWGWLDTEPDGVATNSKRRRLDDLEETEEWDEFLSATPENSSE